ncbi:hypothetical protein [Kitasatospora sp. NPDC059571]|uniref:hypothetical protein n=1 Tax=Kitasatospora sp. NPDC059571 TaxID=3346871 RepID=UPI00368CF801
MVLHTVPPSPVLAAALLPLLALVPAVACMVDISRHPDTRCYPARTWMVICLVGNLFGVAAYLSYGRSLRR